MKKAAIFTLTLLCIVMLAGCAAGPNILDDTIREGEESPAGFWMGFWHGIISPITFIISLFTHNVDVYEVYNTGGWYTFGFMIPLGLFSGRFSYSRKK